MYNNSAALQAEEAFRYHYYSGAARKTADLSSFHSGFHTGQFALVQKIDDGLYRAVRDPLGVGKMFYTETSDGEIHFSDKFVNLFPCKSTIYSLPAGSLVEIGSGGQRRLIRDIRIPGQKISVFDKAAEEGFRTRFLSRLESVFSLYRTMEKEGWTFFIALSGGLDSSIIASLSARYLDHPTACTLDLGKSEDSEKSCLIARHLGVSHRVFPTDEAEILDAVEEAPLLCQDFRDFNVHCAALNILLARNIQRDLENHPEIDRTRVAILTGDLMNEFTCDYAGEVIDGKEYYKLPRIGKKALQDYLISGLDTSDREVSPFSAYGLHCIQPFAALCDLYANLPESVLETEDPKKLLNSFMADQALLDFIPKVKLRAQVGSRENMGILGLCHQRGLDNKTFHRNIMKANGHGEGSIPIFVGRYDVEHFE